MPIFKLTNIFNYSSAVSTPSFPGKRTAGWTESWYQNAADALTVLGIANAGVGNNPGLWPARAGTLPQSVGIVGFRLQQVSPTGPSQSGAINFPGGNTWAADVPGMALLVKCPGQGVGNIRRVKLKGLPDIQVIEGEYQPGASFTTALANYFAALGNWFFRARDISQPVNRIVSISAAGVVTFEQNVNYALLQFVRVLRTLDSSKNLRGGRFQVTVLGPAGNVVTLGSWPFGACTGGSARLDAVIYPAVAAGSVQASRVVLAKAGRSPFQWRGRRSKRR